jgi:recombination DNA repair RAD52 pathway protein
MSFSEDQVAELKAPLDRARVKTREQGKGTVSYIEAYHAENEANRIFGFDAWDRETTLDLIGEPRLGKDKYGNDQWRVAYRAKVRITVRTPTGGVVVREGCGFGSGIDKDVDQAHESALKEAESDAEKRALKTFGNPFGQALYDKTQANVADAPAEENGAVAAAKVAIGLCKTTADLDAWYASNKGMIDGLDRADIKAIQAAFQARVAEVKPKLANPFDEAA